MQLKDVIGQDSVKDFLLREVREYRVPHALLFTGPSGCGKLAMAIAFANYLLCSNRGATDSCGQCPECRQNAKFSHPDLHFSFPFIKKSVSTTAADYMGEWLKLLSSTAYFSLDDWQSQMGDEKKSAVITEPEADRIIDKMSVYSYEGGYKIMIIWLPEKMTSAAANTLLKTLEEPSVQSLFILVTDDEPKLLDTIVSRTQRIIFPPLSSDTITQALESRNGLDHDMAMQVARVSGGSYLRALQHISAGNDSDTYFRLFVDFMRSVYSRDLVKLQKWADAVAAWTRDKQQSYLNYCQNMIRENFVYNFQRPELNFMSGQETKFAVRFSRFINERNVIGFVSEFASAQRGIAQNAQSKIILFNLALKSIVLIRK